MPSHFILTYGIRAIIVVILQVRDGRTELAQGAMANKWLSQDANLEGLLNHDAKLPVVFGRWGLVDYIYYIHSL